MENETQHTPGPWVFNQYENWADFTIWGNDGTAVVTEFGDYLTYEKNCVNARLIAAAPELLDAISLLCNICADELDLSSSEKGKNNWHALTTARQAIAKAKGVR